MEHDEHDDEEPAAIGLEIDDERPRIDRSQSAPIATDDFFAQLANGAAPAFVLCETCKAKGLEKLAMRSPCYECGVGAIRARKEADARDDAFGIPVRYRWAHKDAPELPHRVRVAPEAGTGRQRSARSACVAAAGWQGPVVLFQGPSGSGKSSLAVGASRLLPFRVLYLHALDLERAHIQAKAGTGVPAVIARALAARVLIIDDVGQDKANEFNAVEQVILKRHEAHAPERGRYARTWITTGLTITELEERYNSGIFRRIIADDVSLQIPLVAIQHATPKGA